MAGNRATTAPHPDAELLAVCARLRELEDEWNRLYAATSDADELVTPADHAWQAFSDHVWPAIRLSTYQDDKDPADFPARLFLLRATTLDGLRAKAAAILAMDDAACWCDCRDDAAQLNHNLLEDAAGLLRHSMGDAAPPAQASA